MITDPAAVFFVLAAVVAAAVALERRVRAFRALGAALVGILLAMVLSNTGVIPGESAAYAFLAGPGVGAGIVLILLGVDVRSVAQAGPRMLAAFGVGAVGSVAGATAAALLLADMIGPETWKLGGQYTATYTGGGVNFAAVGAALDTSGELFAAGIAADVIVTAMWMATCLAAPVVFSRAARRAAFGAEGEGADSADPGSAAAGLYSSGGSLGLFDVSALGALVLGTLWASDVLGRVPRRFRASCG